MTINLVQRPANTAAHLTLAPGETCTAEGGAMIAMSEDMGIQTRVSKGKGLKAALKGMSRSLAGEGFFLNHFTAGSRGGEIYLATDLPGDMQVVELEPGMKLTAQSGAFVAHSDEITMDIQWGGFKNLFSGENFVWLNLSGSGVVLLSAFGAIYPVDVSGEYIVDTGNIVAFESGLEFSVSKAGKSWVSSFLGGEGLVCRFTGHGRVWCQTHSDRALGAKLTPHLTAKKQ
ncbi:TIGR00266 family protein [Spirochaeta lutea]|uniref:TIGR00266 family protein n=1 Tax=Spirochaeta lutea TaxID=1480694 RepID=A0A098R574_9SPIO|nr:TIGR00266 family protein [Spirochaeta lutea]KGE73882.1 hypothetical protein DC28_01380 [Spirochaeta lutea]